MNKCVLFVILLFFSFVNTQYSSKCNIPVFKSHDGYFVDFRFPSESISLIYGNSDLNISSWKEFGSIWKVTKLKNFIDIEFTNPIIISSFAINFCIEEDENDCREYSKTDFSVFKFDYISPGSPGFTRLKPIQYPDGLIKLSILSEGLPNEIGFNQILANYIRITKNYALSGSEESNYLIQLELFGCSPLPDNVLSLNDKVIHYDVSPSFMDYSINILDHGWCNNEACSGLTGTLIDGIMVYRSILASNSNTLNWGNKGQPINIQIFFKDNYNFTNFVVHCISSQNLKNCIPQAIIGGTTQKAKTIFSKGTSHGIFGFSQEGNTLEIQLLVPRGVEFILSEIEIFGEEIVGSENFAQNTLQPQFVSIFISSIFFTITLALIIPLLIAVVIICFKIKKQTVYFPIQQEYFKSQKPTPNTFQTEILRAKDEEKFQNPTRITIDSLDQAPITGDSIKRLDTSVLNNMYERIPTISTLQGNKMRESFKRPNAMDVGISPTPRLKLPEIPIYSIPNKTKATNSLNRPASHEGYLEITDLSVNGISPTFPNSEDENPLYDYIRPRSALLPVNSDSNNSITSPISEYVNSKQKQQQYINMNNNSTTAL
ncbi:hypothetical protein LOD99_14893 [Oopsacas minuta]|uniref:Uncharacterized protein n=1 Tax=Oopsacas minuta TaxID=111878 RepID=A0AAV7KE62_9METZ|nr:hypothetical protein LOD99_14893 [Oopsacas minuta]